jgi:uncharacterized protein
MADEEKLTREGPFWGMVLYQTVVFLGVGFPLRLSLFIWRCLSLFLLGMYFVKSGLLTNIVSNRQILRNWAVSGTVIGFILNLFAGGIQISGSDNHIAHFILSFLLVIGPIIMALGYIGAIVIISGYKMMHLLRSSLAAVGRLALSNYLLQSIIAGLIFKFYGFALYDQLNLSTVILILLAIFILQLVISVCWLKYYNYGPVEWVWRRLTYQKKIALRRVK